MPPGSRLALWCLALLLSLSLYVKGRVPTGKGEGAAFRVGGGGVVVRLAGDFPRPGLYLFPVGSSVSTVIMMTQPKARIGGPVPVNTGRVLVPGEILTLTNRPHGAPLFSVCRMRAKERMLLGIPLDPDLLDADEWSALPGIGPRLAVRIAADRQKYGVFGSLDGLLRVPGIGPGRLAAIRRYF